MPHSSIARLGQQEQKQVFLPCSQNFNRSTNNKNLQADESTTEKNRETRVWHQTNYHI